MKKAVKQSAVMEKEIAEILIDGENAVAMGNIDQFKGHGSSALHGIEISASRAETAVTAERNKF